jgi:hypothetical protein
MPRSTHAHVSRQTAAERLFAALDGRDLMIQGEAWHLEVYSVCEEAGRRWIQMAVDGPRRHMVTLALATRAGVKQTVQALSQWLEEPSETHLIVKVA